MVTQFFNPEEDGNWRGPPPGWLDYSELKDKVLIAHAHARQKRVDWEAEGGTIWTPTGKGKEDMEIMGGGDSHEEGRMEIGRLQHVSK